MAVSGSFYMKITKEFKIGIIITAAIGLFIWGFNFLKGKSVFSKTPVLYAEFPDIGTLEKSNQVKINGLPVV